VKGYFLVAGLIDPAMAGPVLLAHLFFGLMITRSIRAEGTSGWLAGLAGLGASTAIFFIALALLYLIDAGLVVEPTLMWYVR